MKFFSRHFKYKAKFLMKFWDFCYFKWMINFSKSFDAWWWYDRSTVAPTAVIFIIYYLLTFFNSIILDNRCLYIILCTVYTDTVSEFFNCTIKLCHFLNIVKYSQLKCTLHLQLICTKIVQIGHLICYYFLCFGADVAHAH